MCTFSPGHPTGRRWNWPGRKLSRPDLRSVRRPGKGALVLPPLLFVAAMLGVPVIFIALFSVGLRSNIPGAPVAFSLANWKDFLFGGGGAFRGRFVYSMEVTLGVSVLTTVAAYPLAYFLSFVARRRRYALLLLLLAPFFTSYLLRVIACRSSSTAAAW